MPTVQTHPDSRVILDDVLAKFRLATASWPSELSGSAFKHQVAIFDIQRGGSRYFWDLSAVPSSCGIDSGANKSAGAWVHKSLARWGQDALRVGFPIGCLRSQKYGAVDMDNNCARCLPFVSVPTAVLLFRLMTWSFCTKRCRGLASESDQQRTIHFLASLCNSCRGVRWAINVFFECENLKCNAAIGFFGGGCPRRFEVDQRLMVDLDAMRNTAGATTLLSTVAERLRASSSRQVHLIDFLAVLSQRGAVKRSSTYLGEGVGKQVAWHVAKRIEQIMLQPHDGCLLKVALGGRHSVTDAQVFTVSCRFPGARGRAQC